MKMLKPQDQVKRDLAQRPKVLKPQAPMPLPESRRITANDDLLGDRYDVRELRNAGRLSSRGGRLRGRP